MARNTSGSSSTVNITGFGIELGMKNAALWLLAAGRASFWLLARPSRYNFGFPMSSPLASAIADLSSGDPVMRSAAATEIYRRGRTPADRAVYAWWNNAEFAQLCGASPAVTVGLAVRRETFARIHEASGLPSLALVPPDQDAEEFELQFPNDISLDVLTTRDPSGQGVIARYLAKFGEGVQQVEFRCKNVDRAAQILKENFGVQPIYPQTRAGAGDTRVNFFLVSSPNSAKVLIELYET
jgi:hypothetical protein